MIFAFKNSSSLKSYTYLERNSSQLVIIEGMFDLLSLAALNEALLKTSDILILNSIAFIKDIEHHITTNKLVYLYLDNDTAGQNATQYLMNTYKHVIDQSDIYKNHKDLNDLLCYEKRKEI